MQIMNHDHPRWQEFLELLDGPKGCNFRKDEEGKFIWNCGGVHHERPLATAILEDMGDIDIPASMAFFDEHGGYCDCEILFNVF